MAGWGTVAGGASAGCTAEVEVVATATAEVVAEALERTATAAEGLTGALPPVPPHPSSAGRMPTATAAAASASLTGGILRVVQEPLPRQPLCVPPCEPAQHGRA